MGGWTAIFKLGHPSGCWCACVCMCTCTAGGMGGACAPATDGAQRDSHRKTSSADGQMSLSTCMKSDSSRPGARRGVPRRMHSECSRQASVKCSGAPAGCANKQRATRGVEQERRTWRLVGPPRHGQQPIPQRSQRHGPRIAAAAAAAVRPLLAALAPQLAVLRRGRRPPRGWRCQLEAPQPPREQRLQRRAGSAAAAAAAAAGVDCQGAV